MLKKVCSIMLAVAILAGCVTALSGCGAEDKTAGDTVIHWYMKKPVGDMSRQQEVEAEANKIIYEKLGVKLQFHFIETASWEKRINVLLSSGADYDIISTSATEFINNAQKNCFADISEALDKYGSTIKEKSNEFAWNAVTINDKVVGIPGQTFYVPYSAFAFKKDLVDKYNFDYENASSYKAIEPYLETIKKNEKGITPLVATIKGGITMPRSDSYSETNLKFICYDNNTNEFKLKYDIPAVDENNRTVYDFAKKGYISSDAISKNEPTSEMKSGKYAVVNGRRSAEKSSNLYGFECVESNPSYGVISTTHALNSVNAIAAGSKNIDKAVQLLNLIWEDTYLSNTLAYGIEGKDYTVDKGDVHNYESVDEIHITTNSGTDVKWSIWHNWLGPLWDQWDSPWNSRESLAEMQKLNEEAKVSPIMGFIINVDPIKTEVAQINSIYDDAEQVFFTGSMPDYDKYVNDLKKKFSDAGIDTVLAEINKQFAQWQK